MTLEDVVEELIGEEIMDETDFDEGSLAAAAAVSCADVATKKKFRMRRGKKPLTTLIIGT